MIVSNMENVVATVGQPLCLAPRHDTSPGAARTRPRASGEGVDHLPGEALDHRGLVGDARHVGYEVVHPSLDPWPEPLDDLLRRPDHEPLRVLVEAHPPPGEGRGFFGIVPVFEQEDVHGGGACDLLVVAPEVLAVPAQHAELVAQPLRVAADVAGVAPAGDEPQGDLLAAAPDPERRVRRLHALGLVYGPVYLVELAVEDYAVLGPHAVDDLAGLLEGAHPYRDLGEAVAVGAPLVLVPAGAEAEEEPAVAHHVDRRGDLGEERRVAVAVAGDHLPDLDALGVAREPGADRPALEDGVLGRLGGGVEVVVDPDGVVGPGRLGHLGHPRHRLVLLMRVLYLDQVHAPPLRDEDAEIYRHRAYPPVDLSLPPSILTALARGPLPDPSRSLLPPSPRPVQTGGGALPALPPAR